MLFIATYSFLREIILDNEFISSFKIHKDMDSVEKKETFCFLFIQQFFYLGSKCDIARRPRSLLLKVYITTMVLFLIGQKLSSEK